MKFIYEITKYNPIHRDKQRRYLRDEWTAYSDISREYDNKVFSLDEYLEVENKYIQAIIQFMEYNKVTSLQINNLKKTFDPTQDVNSSQEMINIYKNIKNRVLVSGDELENVCKLVLREYIWCTLKNAKNMDVDFKHDYYMDITSKSMCKDTISNIEKSGLFVEEYESPRK